MPFVTRSGITSIVDMVRLWLSPRKRLLNRLAETAADAEGLAANLTRHAELCTYPTLKAGLKELATTETGQANAMRQLLLDNGGSPQLPIVPLHDGSSNWERLRNDLALQVRILRALHSQLSEWSAIDPQIAERLRQSASQEERHIEQLRDLTLKCDPQALD
jgi:bacterioferritin (cytochrome b1)